jgi:hypothetical protein
MVLIQMLTTLFVITDTSIYFIGIQRGKVKPVLATRLLFSVALTLSTFTTFRETGFPGVASNILNIADMFSVVFIMIVILLRKDTNWVFTKLEKTCLTAVLFIFVIWLITNQNVIANLLVQMILVVAYMPTWMHLWNTQRNTESLSAWTFDFLASGLGIITPLQTMDFLPIVYGIRSVISTFLVVILILRLKYRNLIDLTKDCQFNINDRKLYIMNSTC